MQYTVKMKQNLYSLQILIMKNGLFQSLRLDKFTGQKKGKSDNSIYFHFSLLLAS